MIVTFILVGLLISGIGFFVFRRSRRAGAQAFTSSRSYRPRHNGNPVSFDEVAGVDEAKEELKEVVQFLRDRSKFARIGATIPKGVLLVGPPGTGKTLLARVVASEARVNYFATSASEFMEMYVGVGAARIRDLFKKAKREAPSVIFIDEIDTIGRTRASANSAMSRKNASRP